MYLPILYEKITDREFPVGFYYAHLPSLGLTTHGQGIEGAKAAALDLISVWTIKENSQKNSDDFVYSVLEV